MGFDNKKPVPMDKCGNGADLTQVEQKTSSRQDGSVGHTGSFRSVGEIIVGITRRCGVDFALPEAMDNNDAC
jgi:hypothetical protein